LRRGLILILEQRWDSQQIPQLHAVLTKTRGPYSANRKIQLMRTVFNKGIQWKVFDGENPFKAITLHEEKPRERFLSEEEAGALLKTLDDMQNIQVGLVTGTIL